MEWLVYGLPGIILTYLGPLSTLLIVHKCHSGLLSSCFVVAILFSPSDLSLLSSTVLYTLQGLYTAVFIFAPYVSLYIPPYYIVLIPAAAVT